MERLSIVLLSIFMAGCASFHGVLTEKGAPDQLSIEYCQDSFSIGLHYEDDFYDFRYPSGAVFHEADLSGIGFVDSWSRGNDRFEFYSMINLSRSIFMSGQTATATPSDRIPVAEMYLKLIKNYPMLQMKIPFFDPLRNRDDLKLVLSAAGIPLAINAEDIAFPDGEIIGRSVFLLYADSVIRVIIGHNFSYSKLDFVVTPADLLNKAALRDKVKAGWLALWQANYEDEIAKGYITQEERDTRIAQSVDALSNGYFERWAEHFKNPVTEAMPEWVANRYPNHMETFGPARPNAGALVIAKMAEAGFMGVTVGDFLDGYVADSMFAGEVEAAYKAASNQATERYNQHMAEMGAVLNVMQTMSMQNPYYRATAPGAVTTGGARTGGGQAYYYDAKITDEGKSSPIGPFHTAGECGKNLNENKGTMDFRVSRPCYAK
ncbi:MAG: hypothetical protein EPN93_03960 [Spirochaetes bacterium]|nr:MAG: hypothetical protein EPN93_03960 [Spirochaetota bacterium]